VKARTVRRLRPVAEARRTLRILGQLAEAKGDRAHADRLRVDIEQITTTGEIPPRKDHR
jgi:hypothetical protein